MSVNLNTATTGKRKNSATDHKAVTQLSVENRCLNRLQNAVTLCLLTDI